jgi:6-phosphogluconolactonase/glucosamine-6-phosphate isomerase/deaminase
MDFRKISSIQPVVDFIADRLKNALATQQSVLWLVPGGSSIVVAVEISRHLQGQDLHKLAVTLTDERYGPIGHSDSNWQQLTESGFALPGALMVPVLSGDSMETTTQQFHETLKELLQDADYTLGFFGIGPDGHTAGILPGSTPIISKQYAASYEAGNFKRITMTPLAILRLNEAVVYATGEAKRPILDQLETRIEIDQQPAQALKFVPKLTIFNDQKGEI